MKKTPNRFVAILLGFVLCFTLAGCIAKPNQTKPTDTKPSETLPDKPALSYALTYYYNIDFNLVNGEYVSQEIQQLLNSFGKPQKFTPVAPTTKTYTEIPEFENNAKGTDPICILLPDLDISKYRICAWRDKNTGLTESGWYRIIGGPTYGMMTDELVSYEVDSSGNVTQYKTVNLGKYDDLGLDESKLEQLRITFAHTISSKIGAEQFYQYFYTTTSQTPFRIFTDDQGRLIMTASITLTQNDRPLEVDLYAVVS